MNTVNLAIISTVIFSILFIVFGIIEFYCFCYGKNESKLFAMIYLFAGTFWFIIAMMLNIVYDKI